MRSEGTLYVVAATRVGEAFLQRLHALDLATGADRALSPVTITAPGFAPLMQSQRPGLLLSGGKVYIGYGSHCDKGPYHGFLFSYDAKSLQQTGVFNTSPAGKAASIWQFGQAPAVDTEGNIYFVTGNGSWNGTSDFSESFLKLAPDLKMLDWFTPRDHAHLDSIDGDLDCSGAVLVPGTSLVMDAGKQGVLYLVDAHHMGHLGDGQAVQHFQATSSQLPSLVYWNSATSGALIYMWGQADRLRAYRFDGKTLKETPFATRPEVAQGHPGAMMSLSANGNKDGILWAPFTRVEARGMSRDPVFCMPMTRTISRTNSGIPGECSPRRLQQVSKAAAPTIANGKVYLASFGTQNTGSGQLCVYGLLADGSTPSPPSTPHASAGDGQVSLSWVASENANTYAVKRATKDARSFEPIASGLTSPTFTDLTAENGMTYRYTVNAANSNGDSGASSIATVFLPKSPAQVGLLPPGPGRELTERVVGLPLARVSGQGTTHLCKNGTSWCASWPPRAPSQPMMNSTKLLLTWPSRFPTAPRRNDSTGRTIHDRFSKRLSKAGKYRPGWGYGGYATRCSRANRKHARGGQECGFRCESLWCAGGRRFDRYRGDQQSHRRGKRSGRGNGAISVRHLCFVLHSPQE